MKINTTKCGPRRGKLDSTSRELLPDRAFALPGRHYPLYVVVKGEAVPDREHAINAKARARQQFERGRLTSAELARVQRQADQVIAWCDGHRPARSSSSSRRRPAKASSCGCSHALEAKILKALPGLHRPPVPLATLARKLRLPEPKLEQALRQLWRHGQVSLEHDGHGGTAWRAGQQAHGTRGQFTVKLYCEDGAVTRKGASTLEAAMRQARKFRRNHAGTCSVSIVDNQGVILQLWSGEGGA